MWCARAVSSWNYLKWGSLTLIPIKQCVERLKAESSRDPPSIHGWWMTNPICYFSKMPQARTIHDKLRIADNRFTWGVWQGGPPTQKTADMSSCDRRRRDHWWWHPMCHWWARCACSKVNDTLPLGKQSIVLYYIYPPQLWPRLHWGARQRLEMRLKKQQDACERGMTEKSAVVEHAQENHHLIHWEETTVLDHDRGQELRWRRPCTFRWHPQRSASIKIEEWKALVAGPLWWGGRERGAILTDWPPMTCTLTL